MVRRLLPTLAFSCSIAALVILIGPRDLESYDTAFFSLDRGTAVQSEHVLGHPVYTLSLGLGLRLPLHGSLGASPVAALGPLLPMPLTYGLLLACAIASALMVVRYALEPMCGRLVSWLAIAHLFCSMPIVTYTISSDWPEIVVAYIAIVACVFAPHALLAARAARSTAERRIAWLSIAGVVWSLIAVAHIARLSWRPEQAEEIADQLGIGATVVLALLCGFMQLVPDGGAMISIECLWASEARSSERWSSLSQARYRWRQSQVRRWWRSVA